MSTSKSITLVSAGVIAVTGTVTGGMGAAQAVDATPSPSESPSASETASPAPNPSTSPSASESPAPTPTPTDTPTTPPERAQATVEKVELQRVYMQDDASGTPTKYADKGITYNDIQWFKEAGTFELNIQGTADGELQEVTVLVDGKEEFKEDVTTSSKVVELTLKDTAKEIKVLINGVGSNIIKLAVDKSAPTGAQANFSEATVNDGETTVFKPGTTVSLSGLTDDDGNADFLDSGIKDVVLEKLEEGSSTWSAQGTATEDLSHSWELSGKGQYRFKVTDHAGNVATFNLWDISDTKQNTEVKEAENASIAINVSADNPANEAGWYVDPVTVGTAIQVPTGLTGVTVKVNGQDVDVDDFDFLARSYTSNIDLSKVGKPDNGIYTIEVTSTGLFGYSNTETKEVKIDSDNPRIENVTISNSGNTEGSVTYLRDNTSVTWNALDNHSGVSKVEVIYTNESVIQVVEEVPNGGADTYSINVATGTGYRLKVTDNVGKVTESSFTDLGLPSNDFFVDTNAPRIEVVNAPTVDYVKDGTEKWVRVAPTLTWQVTDNNTSSVVVVINGTEHPAQVIDGLVTVNLADYPSDNGRYDVTLRVTDKAGNVSESSDTYFVDGESPVDVTATLGGELIDRGYGKFSRGEITLTPGANDTGSGINRYEVLDANMNVIATLFPGATTIVVPGTAKFLRVIDNVGNATGEVRLATLTGMSDSDFYVDNTAPSATINIPEAQYNDWYKADVDFTVDFSDNLSLYNGYVTVNGQKVNEFTADSMFNSQTLNVSTQGIAPDSNGAYVITAYVTDSAGNTFEVSRTIYKDTTAPEIVDFIFTDLTYNEGQSIAQDDRYGFFAQGATSVTIVATDQMPGSGVATITYTLRNDDGSFHSEGQVVADGGRATVQIPAGFKGYISAVATDNVGNVSESRKPSGIVTEDRNWHINSSSVDISLPGTDNRDAQGTALYNQDVLATLSVEEGASGIRTIEWGIGDQTLGTTNVDINGNVSGDAVEVVRGGKNLVYSIRDSITVSAEANGQRVWARTVDRAGHTSSDEELVSVDKTAPRIDVTYDVTKDSTYYNTDRVATVTVTDANFDPNGAQFTGTQGTASDWVNTGGDTWQARVVFNQEQEYEWGVTVTDRAGNKSDTYNSGTFTIDKSNPNVEVIYSTDNAVNGNYYNADRTARLVVTDSTFDPNRVEFEGNGTLGSWQNVGGNRWEAQVVWDGDGEREFNISITDKADNTSVPYTSGKFIVDTTNPTITVDGVKNGTSYRNPVNLLISTNDNNIDLTKSKVTLKSRKQGDIALNGTLTKNGGGFTFDAMNADRKWDDLYIAEATIVDMAGNESTETITFSVNRYGSTFNFLHEDFKGKFFQSLPNNVELTQETVDRMALNKFNVVVLKDGSPISVPPESIGIAEAGGDNSDWLYKVDVNKDLFNGNDGIYQVQLHVESEDGVKESTVQQEYTFGIDSTSPEVIISGLESDGSYNGVSRDVSVEIRDLSGPETVKITLNGKEVDYRVEDGNYNFQVPASRDRQSLEVDVIDLAGNRTLKSADDFFISANVFETITHSKYFGWLIGAIFALIAGVLAYFLKKRRDDEKEEEARQEMRENALRSSSLSKGSASRDSLAGIVGTAGVAGTGAVASGAYNSSDIAPLEGENTEVYQEDETHLVGGYIEDAEGGVDDSVVAGSALGTAPEIDPDATDVYDGDDDSTDVYDGDDTTGSTGIY